MRADSAVRRGQRRSEMLMTDTALVVEVVGESTDPVTGVVVDVVRTVYDGPCRVQSSGTGGNEPDAGGHRFLVMTYEVHFPLGTNSLTGFDSGTQVTIVQSRNPSVSGRVVRLTEPDIRSFNTADRWKAELVIS